MRTEVIAVILGFCMLSGAIAQPPRKLPASLDDPPVGGPPGPLSPAEAARQRETVIKALKEDIRSFDPATVTAAQVEGRWQLRTPTELLKNFGNDRTAAFEAAQLIRNLRINQMGIVPGSQPAFEYWLVDGKVPRGANSRLTIIPIAARMVRAEKVAGSWVVTDGSKGLYDFGSDADAAKKGATVFLKYGFNQIGVIGSPRPAMLYPLLDPRQVAADKVDPLPPSAPLALAGDVARTSLLLPGNGYAGPKSAFDPKRLDIARSTKGEWMLRHDGDLLGKFGGSEVMARSAMKAIQDSRCNEIARIGESAIPIFLMDGQAIHGEPLSATKMTFRSDRLKVQKLRDRWWIFEDIRPLLEVGSQADAELMIRVIKAYDLKTLCLFGRPESGGLRLFTAGR